MIAESGIELSRVWVRYGHVGEGLPMLDVSRDEIIKRLMVELPSLSDKRVAWIVNVDIKHVNQIRREMLASGESLKRRVVDDPVDDS